MLLKKKVSIVSLATVENNIHVFACRKQFTVVPKKFIDLFPLSFFHQNDYDQIYFLYHDDILNLILHKTLFHKNVCNCIHMYIHSRKKNAFKYVKQIWTYIPIYTLHTYMYKYMYLYLLNIYIYCLCCEGQQRRPFYIQRPQQGKLLCHDLGEGHYCKLVLRDSQ